MYLGKLNFKDALLYNLIRDIYDPNTINKRSEANVIKYYLKKKNLFHQNVKKKKNNLVLCVRHHDDDYVICDVDHHFYNYFYEKIYRSQQHRDGRHICKISNYYLILFKCFLVNQEAKILLCKFIIIILVFKYTIHSSTCLASRGVKMYAFFFLSSIL